MKRIIIAILVLALAGAAFAAGFAPTTSGAKTVTTAATALSATAAECRSLTLINTHASATVYVGTATVATTTGLPLLATKAPAFTIEYPNVTVSPTDVYVISAAGGEVVSWICLY